MEQTNLFAYAHKTNAKPTTQPRARNKDPETSHEAAKSVRNVTATHEAIVAILAEQPYPLTDEQIHDALRARHFQVSPSGARTRRAELVTAGRVEFAGSHGTTLAGRATRKWQLIAGASE